ncbi:MAG: LysR family transcriptional regulator [Steroidobacteraceae bacterium]
MDRLHALRVFVRVAELGSFTRAADSLSLQKGAASTAIQQLEGQLGARLFERTTRRVALTQDGRACYERAKDLLADADEFDSMFRQAPNRLSGRLRVDMSAGMAQQYVLPHLPAFAREHPELEFEISATDRLVDVVREGFDCVLRVGKATDPNLVARVVGHARLITCASPAYLALAGIPRTPGDLGSHQLVHYVTTFGGKPEGWEYFDGTSYVSIPMSGRITVNNAAAYLATCVAGFGLIQVPAFGVSRHLAEGTLVEVLKDYEAEPMPLTLLHAHRRVPQRVRAFMDWLTELLKPHL